MDENTNDRTCDVVVIGGGGAGLGGVLQLGRSRRSVVVVDAGEPRNATAAHMHGYLGREGEAPANFLAIGRREVAGYGVQLVDGGPPRSPAWTSGTSRPAWPPFGWPPPLRLAGSPDKVRAAMALGPSCAR